MTTIPLTTNVTGSGPGVLLTHGAGGSIEGNFAPIIPDLAKDHTVIAPDYPGANVPLTLDGLADAVVETAVESGVEDFTILGFSLGTTVAVRAAARHPERVRGLLLTAGFARPDNRLRLAMGIWQDTLRRGERETFARFTLSTSFSASFINGVPSGQLPQLIEQIAASVSPGTVEQAALVAAADTTGDLAKISVPTMVIATTEDLLVDPGNSRLLADNIVGAEYAEIAAGHVVMAERPTEWQTTIEKFLQRHRL